MNKHNRHCSTCSIEHSFPSPWCLSCILLHQLNLDWRVALTLRTRPVAQFGVSRHTQWGQALVAEGLILNPDLLKYSISNARAELRASRPVTLPSVPSTGGYAAGKLPTTSGDKSRAYALGGYARLMRGFLTESQNKCALCSSHLEIGCPDCILPVWVEHSCAIAQKVAFWRRQFALGNAWMLCETCHHWKSTRELKGHKLFSFFGLLRRQATWLPGANSLAPGSPVPMPWQFKPHWTHSDGTVRSDDPSLTAMSLSALRICSSAGPCKSGRARAIDLWVRPEARTLELTDHGASCAGQFVCTVEPT